MRHFGIIGNPVKHSLSKSWFECYFAENNTPAYFSKYDISTRSEFLSLVHNTNLEGLLVTAPLKSMVYSIADKCENKQINACNIISINRENEKPYITAYNTDWEAFMDDLLLLKPNVNKSALIFGTGGAAIAVAFALDKIGMNYNFVSRYKSNDDSILFFGDLQSLNYLDYSLFINATPLGRYPLDRICPPLDYRKIVVGSIAYDLNYMPGKSLFLERCEDFDCIIRNGEKMVVNVYRKALKLWNL